MKQMKFIFVGLFLTLFALATLYAFSYYMSQTVSFEDINLEMAIRETLDEPDSDITISHLLEITNFEAVGADIQSLDGIQYMTNVRTLNLEDNFIEDVRPLKDLTSLRELNLRNNEIISLEAIHFDQLNGLTNLKVLNLRHNVKLSNRDNLPYQQRLEDISLVSSLPSLESLILRDNHIKDPTPLADLTQLNVLDISQNPIINGDFSILSQLQHLEELNLRETDVKNLNFLTEMTDLTYLNLHSNSNITSIQPIRELTDLETLIIPNVPINEEITIISNLHQLRRLNVRNTGIEDVQVIAELMKNGALQDDAGLEIEASIDLSFNPIPLEKDGDEDGFFPLRNYWTNITDRTPETLLPPKTESIYLNEYMASNSETFSDVNGNYYDWIELYNPGNHVVSLEGYYLTDDPTNLTRYRLPDVNIEADSTLIVFASGEDYVDRFGMIHTNFSIDRHGEPIILVAPDQKTIVDYFPSRQLPKDISFGRSSDNETSFYYFNQPTPGATNHSEGSKTLLQAPKFSHSGGFYQSSFELSFDVPESHTVYYTSDGSSPTKQSIIYREPVEITETISSTTTVLPKATTIRAITYDENNQKSDVMTNTYLVGENVDDYFSFPVISITTDPDHLFDEQQGLYVNENYHNRGREWERPIFLELFEPNGVRSLNQNLGVRIHGGFTREYPQKSLRLYTRSSYDQESTMNYPFFENLTAKDSGLPIDQFQRILLRNGGNDWDGTLFRDVFMQELVSDLDTQATQASRPSILFINGDYWGIHNIRERQDEYYLASHFNVDPDKVTILSGPGADFDKGDYAGRSHYHEILSFITEHDLSEPEHYQSIKNRIDINNFIDYNIAQMYFANTDWPHNNVRMWRYNGENVDQSEFKDGRWRWLLFDTDFGFTRYDIHSDHLHDTISWVLEEDESVNPPERAGNFLFRHLIKNDDFKQAFLRRFQNHLNITFRRDHVLAEIDRFKQLYEPEMPKQLSRWDQYGRQMDFWEYEVSRLNDFAQRRAYVLKQYLSLHFDLYSRFEVTIITDDPQNGQIFIDDLPVFNESFKFSEAPYWKGEYYENLPITMSAQADDGYQFIGWEREDGTIDTSTTITLNENVVLKPVYEAVSPVFTTNYESDIQRAKTLTIIITYVFSLTLSLVVIWTLKYFIKETYHKQINWIVSLSVLLSALLLFPLLLRVWEFGIEVFVQQLSIFFLLFTVCIGAYIGSFLPHHTKNIKTFDA